MTDRERLRGLAEAANSGLALRVETLAFRDAASPSVVLGLLGELERAESRIAELEAQRDAAALDRDAAVQAMPHDEEIAEFRSVIRYVGKSGAHDEVCDSADALTKWIDVAEATKRCLESRAALRSHAKGVDRV